MRRYVRAGGHSPSSARLAPPRAPRSRRGSLIRLPLRSPWAVLAAALLSCSVAGPATEVKEALARTGPLRVAVGTTSVFLHRPRFSDVTVSMEGGKALVLAMVEAEGQWEADGRAVPVSYVGREAFEMERCAGARWCPVGAPLPALAGVLEALAAREEEARVSLQIRVERDRATVGEDVQRLGQPVRRRYDVVRKGTRWHVGRGS